MEYTKDVIFNVHYVGKEESVKLKIKRWTSKLIKMYENNKFIINALILTTILIMLDLCMVSSFINLLVRL